MFHIKTSYTLVIIHMCLFLHFSTGPQWKKYSQRENKKACKPHFKNDSQGYYGHQSSVKDSSFPQKPFVWPVNYPASESFMNVHLWQCTLIGMLSKYRLSLILNKSSKKITSVPLVITKNNIKSKSAAFVWQCYFNNNSTTTGGIQGAAYKALISPFRVLGMLKKNLIRLINEAGDSPCVTLTIFTLCEKGSVWQDKSREQKGSVCLVERTVW